MAKHRTPPPFYSAAANDLGYCGGGRPPAALAAAGLVRPGWNGTGPVQGFENIRRNNWSVFPVIYCPPLKARKIKVDRIASRERKRAFRRGTRQEAPSLFAIPPLRPLNAARSSASRLLPSNTRSRLSFFGSEPPTPASKSRNRKVENPPVLYPLTFQPSSKNASWADAGSTQLYGKKYTRQPCLSANRGESATALATQCHWPTVRADRPNLPLAS